MKINVTRTRQGVNMGDHAQDVTDALDVDPSMTVGDLAQAALTEMRGYPSARSPIRDAYLTIRIATPLPEVAS